MAASEAMTRSALSGVRMPPPFPFAASDGHYVGAGASLRRTVWRASRSSCNIEAGGGRVPYRWGACKIVDYRHDRRLLARARLPFLGHFTPEPPARAGPETAPFS